MFILQKIDFNHAPLQADRVATKDYEDIKTKGHWLRIGVIAKASPNRCPRAT